MARFAEIHTLTSKANNPLTGFFQLIVSTYIIMANLPSNQHSNRHKPSHKTTSRWMFGLMWLSLLALLSVFFNDHLQNQFNPNQQVSSRTDGLITEVILQRNNRGHYVTTGTINGTEVTFLLDTGATEVAIPEAIAKDLQLPLGRESKVNTANGTATTFDTQLNNIGIGAITLNNIPAAIAPSYQSDAILLGMSFLKHIEFTQRGDTLILRKY